MLKHLVVALSALFLVSACGKKTEFVVPENRQADKNIGKSFKSIPIQVGLNKAQIAIQRQALGKEFLMSAQLIQLPGVPQFNGSKSRIVLFLEEHGSIYMLEASDGNIINNEIPASFVLAEFPIVESNEEFIIFDFNRGMKQLYTINDWRASDFDGPNRQADKEFASVDVSVSYIKDAYISNSQKLVIRQAAQATVKLAGNRNLNVESVFYIAPYMANPNFVPTESLSFDRTGFFQIAPYLTDVDTKIYASKFDPDRNKQITYAISANTPELYRNAVREGVLYWNKAFGYEKLKVVVAPEGVNAPNPDYNIVQWVNWDTAGMAYADAQMDPRTGEILHAQVFQTSVFAIGNKNRARKYLRGIKDAEKPEHDGHSHVGLSGFSTKGLCNLDHQKAATELAKTIIELDADEETALRLSQDMVRQVVAHEVGHTLGYRHNFAGNLSANYVATEVDGLFKQYVEGNQDVSKIPTSSVMDYLRMESAMPAGALLKSAEKAFSYDVAATQVLYGGESLANAEIPLFCTDSHRGKYLGCDIWDHGRSPLLDLKRKKDIAMDNWSRDLVEKFIVALTNPTSRRPSPDAVVLSPKGDLKMALGHRGLVLQLVQEGTKDLRVHRLFSKVDDTNKRRVAEDQMKLWTREIEDMGGLKELFTRPSLSLVSELETKALRLLRSPQYQSGVGYDEKPYALTSAQTEDIELALASYFDELERVLAKVDMESLGNRETKLVKSSLSDELLALYLERATRYLTAETDEKITGDVKVGDEKAIRVSLPVYKYSQDLRKKAIQLITSQKSVEMDFAYDEKPMLKATFEASLKSALNDNDISKVKVKESKGDTRLWLLQNNELWNMVKGL